MKKVFTFLPGHRSDGAVRDTADALGSVSKRREQLRKAQRTHRQRKHQYFKSVESEVLRLRASEVNLIARVQSLSDQVNLLRMTLAQNGLSEVAALEGKFEATGGGGPDLAMKEISIQSPEQLSNGMTSKDLIADHDISDHVRKAHAKTVEPTDNRKLDQLSGPRVVTSQPNNSQYTCTGLLCNQDMADMGMQFVMALEDPCRPHLELHIEKPNGHALLTSATLFPPHRHQQPSLTALNQTQQFHTAQNPHTIFEKLLALSGQLVVEDELSPTQAWYYILQQSWASKLDSGKLRKLSASLLEVIKCHGFGAVMERNAFEKILNQSLSRIGLD